eukprot:643278-Hanusia_phi.AAC.1
MVHILLYDALHMLLPAQYTSACPPRVHKIKHRRSSGLGRSRTPHGEVGRRLPLCAFRVRVIEVGLLAQLVEVLEPSVANVDRLLIRNLLCHGGSEQGKSPDPRALPAPSPSFVSPLEGEMVRGPSFSYIGRQRWERHMRRNMEKG